MNMNSYILLEMHLNFFPSQDAVYATQYIPAKITEIAWDDKYIITKQIEEKSDPNNPDAAITNKKVNIIGLSM